MTYNFDPDKWYDNELAFLEGRLKSEKISKDAYEKELEKLYARYEEMCARLDGSYQISH